MTWVTCGKGLPVTKFTCVLTFLCNWIRGQTNILKDFVQNHHTKTLLVCASTEPMQQGNFPNAFFFWLKVAPPMPLFPLSFSPLKKKPYLTKDLTRLQYINYPSADGCMTPATPKSNSLTERKEMCGLGCAQRLLGGMIILHCASNPLTYSQENAIQVYDLHIYLFFPLFFSFLLSVVMGVSENTKTATVYA